MHAVLSRADASGNGDKNLLGVAPLYVKSHSYGEYVFDHAWADAYGRFTGKRYYPKLQGCVPFSPVTGSRLLVAGEGREREEGLSVLSRSVVALCDQIDVSSLHVTFNRGEEREHLGEDKGFLSRTGVQYHWENQG